MSFDPYHLYSHPQKKSHKGQIIQKRPVDTQYAASHEDLQRAFIVAQTYGYTISKTIPFVEYSIFGGSCSLSTEKRSITLSDIFNQDVGNSLKIYNPNIFQHTPNQIRTIVIIHEASLESTSGGFAINLIDSTRFTIFGYGYRLLPYNNNQLILIKLSPYGTDLINRGTPQTWNQGIIFDIASSMSNYNALKYGTELPGVDLRYISCEGTANLSGFIRYTLILIVNS